MAKRVHELAVHVRDNYDGDAGAGLDGRARTPTSCGPNLAGAARLRRDEGQVARSVLAKRFGIAAAEASCPAPDPRRRRLGGGPGRVSGAEARAQGRVDGRTRRALSSTGDGAEQRLEFLRAEPVCDVELCRVAGERGELRTGQAREDGGGYLGACSHRRRRRKCRAGRRPDAGLHDARRQASGTRRAGTCDSESRPRRRMRPIPRHRGDPWAQGPRAPCDSGLRARAPGSPQPQAVTTSSTSSRRASRPTASAIAWSPAPDRGSEARPACLAEKP